MGQQCRGLSGKHIGLIARQIFDMAVDLAQSSCGMAARLSDYVGEHEMQTGCIRKNGEAGLKQSGRERINRALMVLPPKSSPRVAERLMAIPLD